MFTIRGLVRTVAVLLTCLYCSACGATPASLLELVISPTPTHTPSPTITLTPTPTSTPEPTATPVPQELGIDAVLANCQALAESGNDIIVKGNIFIPQYAIYGYESWKGMILTSTTRANSTALTTLIKIGTTENTMNSLPQFFSERDLLIRSANNQIIRDGHTVKLVGKMEYKPESKNLRCAIRVGEIESLMPVEVTKPQEVEIGTLQVVMKNSDMFSSDLCQQFAHEKQLVVVRGAVSKPPSGASCMMGFCQSAISDATGTMLFSIVQGYGASSVQTPANAPAPDGWLFYDQNLKEVDKGKLVLTGVLSADIKGCRIIVYEVGQQ